VVEGTDETTGELSVEEHIQLVRFGVGREEQLVLLIIQNLDF